MVRDAARVVRVVVAGFAGAAALLVGARARFLGTASSAVVFSLSSLEMSSLLRFFARVADVSLVIVDLIFGLVAGFGIFADAFAEGAFGAVRVLRAAGTVAPAALVTTAALVGAGVMVPAPERSSTRETCLLLDGIRLTRRSRRDCRLAHCASHWARSFSFRASTGRSDQ